MELSDDDISTLHHIAIKSIEGGLRQGAAPNIVVNAYPEHLKKNAATFVTLKINGQLRGCIGSLISHRPIIIDVNNNAYAAAFLDPRFSPVTKQELSQLTISISILSHPKQIMFQSEQDLLEQIVPFEDGLILEDMGKRGTFLPSVWEELNTPARFLAHLKNKAGFPQDYWSATIKVYRYRADVI